jgi:hypothetical protein
MADTTTRSDSTQHTSTDPYRLDPLIDLVLLIVRDSDRAALREFHDHRSVFHTDEQPALRFTEFLEYLRGSRAARKWSGHDPYILEAAYDLTLDKFINLPEDPAPPDGNTEEEQSRQGPNARCYFGAYLRYVKKTDQPNQGTLQAERCHARALQSFVVRHYRLSCLECARRSTPLARRYTWRVNGSAVSLWMPHAMGPVRCGRWLRDHVEDPDLARPGERSRIQQLIDDRFGRPRLYQLSELGPDIDRALVAPAIESSSVECELTTLGLAKAVAREKAEHIDDQRPSIRGLGKKKLQSMIHRIFDELAAGSYVDAKVAREYHLTKPTFSRFAGSRWQCHRNRPMPDLWRNTAHLLGSVPSFRDAVRELLQSDIWRQLGTDASDTPEPNTLPEEPS